MDDATLRANLRASEQAKELAEKELAVERAAIEFEQRHLVNVQSQGSAVLEKELAEKELAAERAAIEVERRHLVTRSRLGRV